MFFSQSRRSASPSVFDCLAGIRGVHPLSADFHLHAVHRVRTENRPGHLRAPRSHQARNPQDFPLPHVDVLHVDLFILDIVGLEKHLADGPLVLRVLVLHGPPHHPVD